MLPMVDLAKQLESKATSDLLNMQSFAFHGAGSLMQ